MIPDRRLSLFEDLFSNCVFERRFLDKAGDEALGAVYTNADIGVVTGQRFNRALVLDGTGYVNYGNDQAGNLRTGDFSIEVVWKRGAAGTNTYFCGKGASGEPSWLYFVNSANVLRFTLEDSASSTDADATTSNSSTSWQHTVFTADRSGNGTHYVNGVMDGTTDISGESGSIVNTDVLDVGRARNGSISAAVDIELIRLWDKELSAAEVSQLAATAGFGSGTPLFDYRQRGLVGYWPLGNIEYNGADYMVPDISDNENDGVATSMTEANRVNGYGGDRYALDFGGDAAAEYITVTTNAVLQAAFAGDLTISVWIKPGRAGSSNDFIIDKRDATGDGLLIYYNHTSSIVTVEYNAPDISSATVTKNMWSHVVFVADVSDRGQIYINGKPSGSAVNISGTTIDASSNIRVGARSFSSPVAYFHGAMADVVILNRVLTPLAVELLYENQRRGLEI